MATGSKAVWLNRISTAVPPHDVHRKFLDYVPRMLADQREQRIFARLADKAQIEHRYSVLEPSSDPRQLDTQDFYRRGQFPSTAARMRLFEKHALPLAVRAARECLTGMMPSQISHLIVTTCTGLSAPGLDLGLQRELGLASGTERTVIGFMGCYAAINALKAAAHIVRSEPASVVLIVNLELSTLHLHDDTDLHSLSGFMQFADGCAASIVSAAPGGLEVGRFVSEVLAGTRELITWQVGDLGFAMHLSPDIAGILSGHLPALVAGWVTPAQRAALALWAIHPGGRAILDAVESSLGLGVSELRPSREVLRKFGNMSSATVMFVLKELLEDSQAHGSGLAMAFGPGLSLESMFFSKP